mgnify:FL=1
MAYSNCAWVLSDSCESSTTESSACSRRNSESTCRERLSSRVSRSRSGGTHIARVHGTLDARPEWRLDATIRERVPVEAMEEQMAADLLGCVQTSLSDQNGSRRT